MTDDQSPRVGPLVLVILDGWGVSPTWRGNAIRFSNPPVMEQLWRSYPHAVLHAYQPTRMSLRHQVGSSDISHAMLGTGRDLASDLEQVSEAIHRGLFATNPVLVDAFAQAAQTGRPVHLIGLTSTGSVHSDLSHLYALLQLAHQQAVTDVRIHAITDGRDRPPTAAMQDILALETYLNELGVGKIVSVIGRSYAMDRDQHWDRTLAAYRLWVEGRGQAFGSWRRALHTAYQHGLTDEFVPPSRLTAPNQTAIADGDTVIFWNTRIDRLRQMVTGFVNRGSLQAGFRAHTPFRSLGGCVSLISPSIATERPLAVAFPPAQIPTSLGEIISGRNLRQLRAAESEKYAHVTYFFNGGREAPFPGEDRLIIPSSPGQLSRHRAGSPTRTLIQELERRIVAQPYDFVVVNIAHVDLASHTGDLFATAQAIALTDQLVGQLVHTVLKQGGRLVITADHGNAEQMLEIGGDRRHHHSINPVPLIFVDSRYERDFVQQGVMASAPGLAEIVQSRFSLRDVAPTILELLGLPVPVVMTGQSLLQTIIN